MKLYSIVTLFDATDTQVNDIEFVEYSAAVAVTRIDELRQMVFSANRYFKSAFRDCIVENEQGAQLRWEKLLDTDVITETWYRYATRLTPQTHLCKVPGS